MTSSNVNSNIYKLIKLNILSLLYSHPYFWKHSFLLIYLLIITLQLLYHFCDKYFIVHYQNYCTTLNISIFTIFIQAMFSTYVYLKRNVNKVTKKIVFPKNLLKICIRRKQIIVPYFMKDFYQWFCNANKTNI